MKRMKHKITLGLIFLLIFELNTLFAQGPAWFDTDDMMAVVGATHFDDEDDEFGGRINGVILVAM